MTEKKKRLSDGQNADHNGGKLSRSGAPKGHAQVKVKELEPPRKRTRKDNGNPENMRRGGKEAGKLTDQMKVFCEEYVFCFSKSESVRKANYKCNNAVSQANKLLALPQIQEYLAELRAEKKQEDKELRNRIVEELRLMAFSDTAELVSLQQQANTYIKNKQEQPAQLQGLIMNKLFEGRNGRLIKSVKQGRFGIEFSLYSKEEALNMLNRMGGNYEADNEQRRPENSVAIYLPDNGREQSKTQTDDVVE